MQTRLIHHKEMTYGMEDFDGFLNLIRFQKI